MELAQSRRGEYKDMRYLVQGRTTLVYDLPLAELVNDFFDHLKSRTKGYASMEYTVTGYRQNDLVRLDVAINGENVDALSGIVHREKAYSVGKALVTKLKEIVPRAQFKIPIQAKIGAKIVASQQISALKKGMEILFSDSLPNRTRRNMALTFTFSATNVGTSLLLRCHRKVSHVFFSGSVDCFCSISLLELITVLFHCAQVLRRRYIEKEEVNPKAGRRKEANEGHWKSQRPPGGFQSHAVY